MLDKPEIWAPVLATILAVILTWLLGHFNLWGISGLARGVRPVAWVKLNWRLWRAKRIPLRAYLATGEDDDSMRQFKINKIHVLDGKGRSIAGTIELVHTGYWLDSDVGEGKMHLFALGRRGRALEQAKTLCLDVARDDDRLPDKETRLKVLNVHIFGVDDVSSGDYWDDVPESLRWDIQDKLADELMDRAKSGPSFFQFRQGPYPYQGVAFTVSELDGLETLFQQG
jgi:hypothetical protein